jgi:hypothetical protein
MTTDNNNLPLRVRNTTMKTWRLTIACVSLLVMALFAGDVPIKRFLLSTKDDYKVKTQEQRSAFLLKGAYPGIPFIDDIELRVRNEAFDSGQMRYTVRVDPRGVGETFAANRYYKSIAENSKSKFLMIKNSAIKDRYLLAIDFLEQVELQRMLSELSVIYSDKIKVLENKSYGANFDLTLLITAEDENTKIRTQIYNAGKTIKVLRGKIAYMIGDSSFENFDTAGIADIDTIIRQVEQGKFNLDTNNADLDYLRRQIQSARFRFELEKAENRRYIKFLGFSYDNGTWLDEYYRRNYTNKSYNLRKAYQLEVAISIPDLTTARHDIVRRKLDFIAEQDNYEALKHELDEKIKKDMEDLHSFIEQYRFLKARESEVNATSSLKKYLQMEGVDPLVLLSIKESIVKNRLDISKLKFNILSNYIQVIDVAGELSRSPLKNFLSSNREIVEP